MQTVYKVGQIIISQYDNEPIILKQYTDADEDITRSRVVNASTNLTCAMCMFLERGSYRNGLCVHNKEKHLGKGSSGCHIILTPPRTYFAKLKGGI